MNFFNCSSGPKFNGGSRGKIGPPPAIKLRFLLCRLSDIHVVRCSFGRVTCGQCGTWRNIGAGFSQPETFQEQKPLQER